MINKLVLGTVQFGMPYGINNQTGQPEAAVVNEILDFALEQGINTLDTAEAYGISQQVLGNYIATRKEHNLHIISKLSPNIIDVKQLEANLLNTISTLQTGKLDGYLFHSFANFLRYPALMTKLIQLKERGLIGKIGVSIYAEQEELAAVINNPFIEIVQLPFNLLDNNSLKLKVFEQLKDSGKEIHARSVFLQGAFFIREALLPQSIQPLAPYLHTIRELAAGAGVTIEQLALQYVYRHPLLDKVLIGIDSKDQLGKSIEAIKTAIPEDLFREVDKIRVKETSYLYPKNWK